ncbi:hypothetical protein SpCBS45565_g04676 [Spizellomyces sp. 'palustris']|nr:hypothetical protein SpCBS45565_g04676 [Spizellomyces sp. 'palustris']
MDQDANETVQAALKTARWVPFQLPTADGTVLQAFIKAVFNDQGYAILVSDFKRVWFEIATNEKVERKLKSYAKNFSETPVSGMLPYIESYVQSQKPNVRYMSFFEPDKTGELRIHATGTVGTVTFRWVFECAQLHTDVLPPRPVPGDVLYSHLSVPLLMVITEQDRRIQKLLTLLGVKERELHECHETMTFNGLKFPPKRSDPISAEAFSSVADEEFRSMHVSKESLPKAFLENQLYRLVLGKPDNENAVAKDTRSVSPPANLERVPTLPAGPITPSGIFASLDGSSPTGPDDASSSAPSKKEIEKSLEMQRRQEREERLQRLQAEQQQKKKRRKIL